ncbi:DNA methyltransferase [uncultured Leifsonia sp.]|uniref:DNA methyltransferase n=1 Tax=uncultured Leifsonia sp. TaxID=340359 RepID=UPI0028D73231|nr:DNA methyltransferase [uncultured Leifsonia sp.]
MQAIAQEVSVKSRARVKAHGEVFTPRSMVEQMLDLVSDDLLFVDKTFFEPAAGDGNFLVAILQRKLRMIEKHLERDVWVRESLFAVASIYGIELLEDNHQEAKAAMLEEFAGFHAGHGALPDAGSDVMRAATFLVDSNIMCGNTLTGRDWLGDEIAFSWWVRDDIDLGIVIRQPFTFNSLRSSAPAPSLFDYLIEPDRYAPCRIEHVHKEVRAGD